MRYDQFQKIRKRQKEASIAKTEGNSSHRRESQSHERTNDDNIETEENMRNNIERSHPSIPSRPSILRSRRSSGVRVEEAKKRAAGPTDLVDTIRAKSKVNRKGFLPIAMPRANPNQENDSEYEYRSEFEAPDHVEVPQSNSYESRTDVSEMTSFTYGIAPVVSPRSNTSQFSPRANQCLASHVEHLEEIDEVSESQVSYLGEATPRVKVDVTDLEAIFDERKVRGGMKYENRYGLPYETTDFRGDDETSEDSWGKAIVGSHAGHSAQRQVPSSSHKPIDAENYFSKNTTNRQIPSSRRTNIHDFRQEVSNPDIGSPRSAAPDVLVKETMSADGRYSLFIDLSQIEDEDTDEVIDVKTSPINTTIATIAEAVKPQPSAQQQPQKLPPRSPRAISQSPRERENKKLEPDDSTNSPPAPTQDAPSSQPVGLKIQISNPPTLSADTRPSQANEVLAKSMNFFTEQIKTFTDGLGSQFSKIDLLPEKEMDSMLGVLNKDLKEASEKVPQGKEVVEYFGTQIRSKACASDNTQECGSPKNLSLTFSANSIEEMVDTVKTTYQKNIANCGIRTLDEKPALTPQTFIVPISLRGKDYDPVQHRNSPYS